LPPVAPRVDRHRRSAYVSANATELQMSAERVVKLFRNGRNQAVRIPREFELPGTEAIMHKEGQQIVIEPAPKKSLLEILKTLQPIEEEFPEIEDPPPEDVDL
jgi:antitoxin VapB